MGRYVFAVWVLCSLGSVVRRRAVVSPRKQAELMVSYLLRESQGIHDYKFFENRATDRGTCCYEKVEVTSGVLLKSLTFERKGYLYGRLYIVCQKN